jgi:putative FmdB family regulatory protein
MPLYEYECDACGHRFEVIQKFSDAPIEKCPVCGGSVHKLQSAPAFQFKGTGWYVTDYAKSRSTESKSGKESRKSDTSSSASDSGSGEKSASSDTAGAKADTPSTTTPAASTKTDTK